MNERILDLAKWAGYNGHYATEEFDVDEFARLIAMECIAMADEFEIEVNRSGLVDRMKEHFGVEE